MATPEKLLDVARKELGVRESPPGSNAVKYNAWYYGRPVSGAAYPWCMTFVQWVFNQAGARLPYITASCGGLLTWYRRNRPERAAGTPRPGDIVIYDFGHTGIVESVGEKGTITAIEGNTSPGSAGSQSNGGMVCRRTRKTSCVTAYIRPDWEGAGTSTDEKKGAATMDNTPGSAHKEGVEWCRKNGILNGDGAGDLKLTQGVTRQQLCTMLYRYHLKFGKEGL